MKKRLMALITACILALALCSCSLDETVDLINVMSTSNSQEVMNVKDGYLPDYSTTVTVGTALDNFLGSPKWQYFENEDGSRVVQCEGKCTYDEAEVDVCIQFLLNDDNTFDVGAMTMNELEQNALKTYAFLTKVFESSGAYADEPIPIQTSTIQPSQPTTTPIQNESDIMNLEARIITHTVINESDLYQLSQKQVRTLLNELYAYHGYTFTTDEYINIFSNVSWYIPTGKSMEACEAEFNEYERANKTTLVNYEISKGWR